MYCSTLGLYALDTTFCLPTVCESANTIVAQSATNLRGHRTVWQWHHVLMMIIFSILLFDVFPRCAFG